MSSEIPLSKPSERRRVLAEGRFARLVIQNGWEWVERVNTSAGVVIVAVSDRGELVLVEQYRIPFAAQRDRTAGRVGGRHGRQRTRTSWSRPRGGNCAKKRVMKRTSGST